MPRTKKQDTPQEPAPDPYNGLSDDNHNEFAAQLIDDAVTLQEERKELLKRIDTNRTTLRLIVDTGHVSEKQAKFAELTYPPRKSKDEGDDTTGDDSADTTTPNAA